MKTEAKELSLIAGEHDMDAYLYAFTNGEIDKTKPLFPWTCEKKHTGESEICGKQYNFPLNFMCEKDATVFRHTFTDPNWKKQKRDKPLFTNEWSYGRLNIKTMEMERVPINRDGKAWNYLTDLKDKEAEKTAIKDADAYSNMLREIENNGTKTARELKQEMKYKQKMENEYIKIEKREQKEEE